MTKKVITVEEDMPIEEVARVMADKKIGGVPVMKGKDLVGLITETDIFKIFLEMMGAREAGVRVTALVADERGSLARLTQSVADGGGSFISFGQFAPDPPHDSSGSIRCTNTHCVERPRPDPRPYNLKPRVRV